MGDLHDHVNSYQAKALVLETSTKHDSIGEGGRANGPYKYDDLGKDLDNFRLLELLSCDESLRVKLSIDVPPQSETFSPAIKTTHSQRVSFSESVLQHSTVNTIWRKEGKAWDTKK